MTEYDENLVKQAELKASREKEIYDKTFDYFKESYINLVTPVGPTGHFDLAFNIDRRAIVLKAMLDVITTMEKA